jgi:uncharacterized membrane protein
MAFANPLPWWALLLVASAAVLVAWNAYRRVPVSGARRAVLSALRLATLLWLVICLMRPMSRPAADTRDAVVPVLVDASRSMALSDEGARRRLDRAKALLDGEILPALQGRFHTDLLRFGERVAPVTSAALAATDRRTNLGAAIDAVRDRYRGRVVAGIVLISDGGDNGDVDAAAAAAGGPPIYAVGIGARSVARDREVVSITAAESVLADAVADIGVSAVAHGYGRTPFDLRLLENGRPIDVRKVTPAGDGVPVSETFHVSPNRDAPTIYTVEVPAASDEIAAENNARSALVPPPARPRRVLFVEGAPGFEHSFLRRAWAGDRGLEVDSVVRKGRDDSGVDTFYVQAARSRADALTRGFPAARDALFAYDVIVLANVDPGLLSTAQLELTRAFVGERGGGLLVLGARGFQRQGMRETPIEDLLPLDLSDRAGGVVLASASPGTNRVALTASGDEHPVMQLAPTAVENARRWATIPALASISTLGGPRPGAAVLAVTGGPGGVARALVAVQRYGDGRSMIFTGEGAWRWRMMLPAADQSYDHFWRQAVRWLGQTATEPVALTLQAPGSGDTFTVTVDARDASFVAQPDALVDIRVTAPDGHVDTMRAEAVPSQPGRFRATARAARAGVYRITADARRGRTTLGSAGGSVLAGGVDPEMSDPRLNEEALQRVARASGGAMIGTDDVVAGLVERLRASAPAAALAARTDLWHAGWSFALIAVLLGAEWLVRRRWGLR